ncbi:hypothetical protein DMP44_00925 [Shigella sonnei]|nr:hypothetical protein [Shigella sonnei]
MQISGFHDTQIDRRCIHTGGNQRGQERCAKLNHQGHPFIIGNTKEKGECNQVNHLIPTRVLVKGGEITCKILK